MATKTLQDFQKILRQIEEAYSQPGMPKLDYEWLTQQIDDYRKERMRGDIHGRLDGLDLPGLETILALAKETAKLQAKISDLQKQIDEPKVGILERSVPERTKTAKSVTVELPTEHVHAPGLAHPIGDGPLKPQAKKKPKP